ncbi:MULTISPECIES: DUF7024 domain-containing protein [Lysobacter]|uniref:DUF7024 domain-containing protein n=1 Tax=Lysobacter TaxID=68 RepID=UPI001F39030A|nr:MULTISPECIES: glycosyltransferase family 39 protein [Lysobacter]UJB21364.1 glycosyltransferase family 39 protein [Lysobacter capsici]UJQ29520.1 glycosyltransferase family 39 protein [Lysobacter gummosus]
MVSDPVLHRSSWHRWLLGAGGLALVAAMTLRDQNLYAALFADEWSYSSYSRLGAIHEAKLPSYLYLWIFRLTNQCGSEFLDCARVLNALLLLAALPLIYRVLRPYTRPALAALLALASLAAPVNSFAAYFMPESMYYLLFWVLAVAVLRPYAASPLRYGLTAGSILGLMCLVKLHAVFMAIGFGIFIAADALWPGQRERLRPALIVLTTSAAAFLAVRFGLGYLLAGPGSLSLLGQYYQGQAQGNIGQQSLQVMAANLFTSARGHALALSLLFGPLLVPTLLLVLRTGGDEASARTRSAALFALTTLASLAAMTVYFTASMGANENIGRLHLRYYDFCFPLLLLAPLAWRGLLPATAWRRRAAWAIALVLAAITLYAGAHGLTSYSPAPGDSPELLWTLKRQWLALAVGMIGAAACVAWPAILDWRRPRLAALGYYALVVALGAGAVTVSVRNARFPTAYAQAGQWLRDQHPQWIARSQFLGRDVAGLFKARFYADSLAITAHVIEPGHDATDAVDWRRDTAIVFDGLSLPEGRYARKQTHDGFTVYWLEHDDAIDLRQAEPAFVRAMRGLSHPEPFGRWSDGPQVTIELDREVSGSVRVMIEAAAFGPNAGQTTVVRLGTVERSTSFDSTSVRRTLEFCNVPPTRELVIRIAQPTSPQALGISQDRRQLGLALTQLQLRRLGPGRPQADCPQCSPRSSAKNEAPGSR